MATAQRWLHEAEFEFGDYFDNETSSVADAIRAGQRDENDITNR